MTKIEKHLNKRLIGLIMGGKLIGIKKRQKKKKRLLIRISEFFHGGWKEMRKEIKKNK